MSSWLQIKYRFSERCESIACSISDHDTVYLEFGLKKDRPAPVYVTTRSFKNYDQLAFHGDMSIAPWSVIDIFDDFDDKLNAFHLIFDDIKNWIIG